MKILLPDEAANFLRISTYTLLEQARKGLVPAARIGGKWRFTEEALIEFVAEKIKPKECVATIQTKRRACHAPPSLGVL